MLLASLILSGLVLAFVGLVLFRRLWAAGRQVRRRLLAPRQPFLDALARCLLEVIDRSLLPRAGGGGLGDLEVRACDHQDPYRTVADLLDAVARNVSGGGELPVDALVKATYQLSYTLGIPLGRLDPCLEVLIEAMVDAPAAHPVARVQKVSPGDLVDARTMVPVNFGARVLYPLGLIAYDSDGNVLSRARVLCS